MKKPVLILISFALLCVLVFLSACGKDTAENNPTAGLTKVAEGYAAGAAAKVELYTKETTLTSGYTRFYVALYDSVSGNRIDEAHISLTPMMDMGSMTHSAPYENPVSENAEKHLFPCSVTFIMSSMGGSWTLKLNVHNHLNNKEGSLTLPLTISEPVKSRQKSFTASHNGAKYFISLITPSAANSKVGINDFEIAIYKKASMMSWPADSSLTVSLTPEMPTMGHGSPNNVDPVHTGKGHYKGKVNFTMTGLWRLNLDFMSGGSVADTTQYFDVEF
ncbi:MAG: FixH family protein [Chitinophagaceae bacterium]|nr:FixH family protein [Chitinophagaceae bacterium]